MHFNLYLLPTALLATAVFARPSSISSRTNHELMKRHFWCNGVDSESICPEGETMVPIDDYACNTIASAGRLDQISPPVNGERSTTCHQQVPTQKSSAPSAGSLESSPLFNATELMHLTCTKVEGGAVESSVLLNCTMPA